MKIKWKIGHFKYFKNYIKLFPLNAGHIWIFYILSTIVNKTSLKNIGLPRSYKGDTRLMKYIVHIIILYQTYRTIFENRRDKNIGKIIIWFYEFPKSFHCFLRRPLCGCEIYLLARMARTYIARSIIIIYSRT